MNTMTKQKLKSLIIAITLIFAAMYLGSLEDREMRKDLTRPNQVNQ